jgi:hypothetical protein
MIASIDKIQDEVTLFEFDKLILLVAGSGIEPLTSGL